MDIKKFVALIKTKLQTIASVAMVFFLITGIFIFSQPLKYNSEANVLVVQNFPRGTDPSAMAKSNEHISDILARVVSSNLFYGDALNAGFNIDKNYFSKKNNLNAAMENWKKTVRAEAIGDTGIINLNVYHPDKRQLEQIASAVNFILQSKHGQYHGLGNNITIKIIDKPIISAWPAKPNIILDLALAIAAGLIVALYYIYLFPETDYDLKLWPKFKARKTPDQKTASQRLISLKKHSADFIKITGAKNGLAFPGLVAAPPKVKNEPTTDYSPAAGADRQPLISAETTQSQADNPAEKSADRPLSEPAGPKISLRGNINNLF